MRKKWLQFLLAALMCIGLVACAGGDGNSEDPDSIEDACNHSYKAATCTAPAVCKKCGATKGEPGEHSYLEATCTEAAMCAVCGQTNGKPLAHTYNATTLKCTVCGGVSPNRPYAGKKLQIYGIGAQNYYTDYSQFGKGNYLWMMKVAIDEWATFNGVTIEYMGSYNQTGVLAEMMAGNSPDIVFQSNEFPQIANLGITSAFTDEEYAKLADICGEGYLDMMNYKSASHGVVYLWSSMQMVCYNKTMFETFGAKTPKEYFLEGNWTWETFMQCMEEVTNDLNVDGTLDTYGLPAASFDNLVNPWKMDATGKLVSTIDEEWMQDFIQLKYEAFNKNLVLPSGKNQIRSNVTYPMCAMQISDCEPYNFEHLYQTLPNGDELEVVPVPEWRGSNGETIGFSTVIQSAASLLTTCDEREAAVDLLAYLLQCGMKYVSDYSLGAVECEYEGIQGSCDLSKQWKQAFAKVCADRSADANEIRNYDKAYVTKINTYLSDKDKYISGTYADVSALTGYAEIIQMPPAFSIPAIREKYQKALDTYNDLYVSN